MAVVLLCLDKKKIELLDSGQKLYLELVNWNRPITKFVSNYKATSVLDASLAKMLKDEEKRESVQDEYKQIRER